MRIDPTTNRIVGETAIPDGAAKVAAGAGAVWVATGSAIVRVAPA